MNLSMAEVVFLAVLLIAPWLLLASVVFALPRILRARADAIGDEVAEKVRAAVTEAVEEALPLLEESVARGVGEAADEVLPRLRAEVEGGVRVAADDTLPRFRGEVREGFKEALAEAATGGLLGKAGEELLRKGGGLLDVLLGSRQADDD